MFASGAGNVGKITGRVKETILKLKVTVFPQPSMRHSEDGDDWLVLV